MADITGIGSILDFGGKIIDKIFPDKIAQEAERNKAQLALLQLQQSGDIQMLSEQMKAIVAEANSNDPWTSRARPSFMYVMYIIILFSLPIGVLTVFNPVAATAIAAGFKAWLVSIPDELYTLFGVGYLGYTGTRTWEKVKGVQK